MRRMYFVVLATLLVAGSALADPPPLIDYQGYTYETGGFPNSDLGDVLTLVGVADNLDLVFGVDLSATEITVVASGLVSQGQVPFSGGAFQVSYTGGALNLYDDPTKDHDYGVNPPNATVTSTFTNGTLFLGGNLLNFFLFWDPSTGTGAYQGQVLFTGGTALATLNQSNSLSYTFGGALSTAAVGPGNIPAGYDLQVDGVLQVGPIVAVKPLSWGAVKEMYSR
jgi:hypothetical protein